MIAFPPWLIEEAIKRALCEAPHEACGLISAGQDGIHLHAAGNVARDPRHGFTIDPRDHFDIAGTIVKMRRELVGLYHSHPHSGPEPSPTDYEMAKLWPGLTWLIIGLHGQLESSVATHWAGVLVE